MDIQDFINNFAGQFDETYASEFQADTRFRNLVIDKMELD